MRLAEDQHAVEELAPYGADGVPWLPVAVASLMGLLLALRRVPAVGPLLTAAAR
jgi:hypothetical protein